MTAAVLFTTTAISHLESLFPPMFSEGSRRSGTIRCNAVKKRSPVFRQTAHDGRFLLSYVSLSGRINEEPMVWSRWSGAGVGGERVPYASTAV